MKFNNKIIIDFSDIFISNYFIEFEKLIHNLKLKQKRLQSYFTVFPIARAPISGYGFRQCSRYSGHLRCKIVQPAPSIHAVYVIAKAISVFIINPGQKSRNDHLDLIMIMIMI